MKMPNRYELRNAAFSTFIFLCLALYTVCAFKGAIEFTKEALDLEPRCPVQPLQITWVEG